MSVFNFTNAKGEVFSIKGPEGMNLEQAQGLFKQQLDSGALTGFKIGDGLSAATQLADGLKSAAGAAQQALGGLTGNLPSGVNLNSITAGIGALGGAAATQLQTSLAGGAAAFNSLTTAASAATGDISKALSGTSIGGVVPKGLTGDLASGVNSAFAAASGAVTGLAAQAGTIANNAIKTLSGAIGSGIPSAPINVADFAKQIPAVGSIAKLTSADVTGTLAAASKMVGQTADKISNALGVGKFGFDANQLERAGMIKPGTAAAFLSQGDNDLTSVLKTPTVWTGKDGVKGLDGLLNNTGLQDKIQQGLMQNGLNAIKSAGVPVDALKSTAVAGLATMAAKSIDSTLSFVKNAASNLPAVPGLPAIPGADALPANLKSAFDNVAKNAAFAVNLTQQKVEPPFKQETVPEPAANTVNNETQAAAAQRVVGNEKVPSVTQSDGGSDAKAKIKAFIDFQDSIYEQVKVLSPTVDQYEAASSITQEQWEALNAEYLAVAATFNSRQSSIQVAAVDAVNALPQGSPVRATLAAALTSSQNAARALAEFARAIRKRIKDLANKIAT